MGDDPMALLGLEGALKHYYYYYYVIIDTVCKHVETVDTLTFAMTHLLATTSILGRSKLQIFNNINRVNQEQKAEMAVKLPGPLTAIPQGCLV
jgi:hypothetical protein